MADRIPRRTRRHTLGTLLCWFLVSLPLRADDGAAPAWTFYGYGTLAAVHSSEDQADFLAGQLIARGAGHSASWSGEVDSRVGAQLTGTFGSHLTVIGQVVAEQRVDGSYDPHLEWANVKYAFSPTTSVRVGRIVLPAFMVSDFRKVGYANPWVRPPVELYGLIPVTANDGIDFTYRRQLGSTSATLQGNAGRSDTKLAAGTAKARDAYGAKVVLERGHAALHLSYQQAGLTIDSFNQLFDGFRQFGPDGIALAERYDADGNALRYWGVGVTEDLGPWFVMGEWGRVTAHSAIGDRIAWYVSGGRRIGTVTPFATYATVDVRTALEDAGLAIGPGAPPPVAAAVQGLNAALSDILRSRPEQTTWTVGARWEWRPNFDLKLQYDRTRVARGSLGALGNPRPGFATGRDYALVSVAMDFVF